MRRGYCEEGEQKRRKVNKQIKRVAFCLWFCFGINVELNPIQVSYLTAIQTQSMAKKVFVCVGGIIRSRFS